MSLLGWALLNHCWSHFCEGHANALGPTTQLYSTKLCNATTTLLRYPVYCPKFMSALYTQQAMVRQNFIFRHSRRFWRSQMGTQTHFSCFLLCTAWPLMLPPVIAWLSCDKGVRPLFSARCNTPRPGWKGSSRPTKAENSSWWSCKYVRILPRDKVYIKNCSGSTELLSGMVIKYMGPVLSAVYLGNGSYGTITWTNIW